MTWRRDYLYDGETLDAELERVRRELDHPHYGPSAFFDPDREERWDKHGPFKTWPAQSLVSGQSAPSSSLSAAHMPQAARASGEGARVAGDEERRAA